MPYDLLLLISFVVLSSALLVLASSVRDLSAATRAQTLMHRRVLGVLERWEKASVLDTAP